MAGFEVSINGRFWVSTEDYIGYLVNVYHYAQHSAQVISLAGSRCVRHQPELARYYFKHAEEELGHEAWALSDLRALGVIETRVAETHPTPACAAMIGPEYYTAGHGNPVALLGWLHALEALGNDLGHVVARGIDRGIGSAGNASYFLRGHGDADRDHIEDIDEQIHRYANSPSDEADIFCVAEASADLYVRMLDEITTWVQQWT
jgi:pyrroloquinoline quinone (PQQ) biosynthesis protein C